MDVLSSPLFDPAHSPDSKISTMPRSARVLLSDHIYHLTHRCHNGSFFLRFDTVRIEYRRKLWQAVRRFKIIMLNYCITSNEGEFASQYNRRKHRHGAFWSERYHATLIEDGSHFWNCMHYIDLNMVRAGIVHHPADWPWCGYQEIAGLRQRYRILNLQQLLQLGQLSDLSAFAARYDTELDHALKTASGRREPYWTESIAVGSKDFVHRIAALFKNRKKFEINEWADDAWYVRDPTAGYRSAAEAGAHGCCNTIQALHQKRAPILWR